MKTDEIIAKSADTWPQKIAITDKHGDISYQTLYKKITSLTCQLRESGVKPGHGVGVMAQNGQEFIIAVFAVLGCGATVLPILHIIKHTELDSIIKTTGLHAVIDDNSGVLPAGSSSSYLELQGADTLRLTWTYAKQTEPFIGFIDDAAFVRFTSGTTGTSKGVVVSHKGVLERTAVANKALSLCSDDTILWVLPMAFHFLVSIVLYLEIGARILVCPDHLSGTLIDMANRHYATFLYASPLHYRLLCFDGSGRELKSIKRAISTSSALPSGLSGIFFERYGLPLIQAYGIIEIGLPLINLNQPLDAPDSVGQPLPGYKVSILNDQLNPVQEGETGQLAFRGPGMFAGYMAPPTLTQDILCNGWFLSGDQAVQNKEGYVTIVGRSKSMINVAGNKVFPEEVESIINLYPEVDSSRVYGRPHPHMGEIVQADIVLIDKNSSINTEELMRFCRKHITGYKVPQFVSIVEHIDKTPSGKISRVNEQKS